MSLPRKVFLGVWLVGLLCGLIGGLLNVISPGASSVVVNGAEVEGWSSVPVSIGIWTVVGLIPALIAAGITSLFSRKKS